MFSWWPSVKWLPSKLSPLKSLTPALPAFETLASLTVVDVKVTPIHEGVITKVASTSVAVKIIATVSLTVVDDIEVLLAA